MFPVVVAAALLNVALSSETARVVETEARSVLERMLVVAVATLRVSDGPAGDLQRVARAIGAAGVRATFIAPDGRVLADSDVSDDSLARMENHAGRPEIVEAWASGTGTAVRYSTTIGAPLMYVARRIGDRDAGLVLRLAMPMHRIEAENSARRRLLAFVTAAALLLAAVGVWIAAALLTRRVRRLSEAAAMVAAGRGDVSLDDRHDDEFTTLSRALSDLARSNRAALDRLALEGNRLRTILDAMREGMMAVGPDGRITLVNRAMLDLVGYRGDAVGLTPAEVSRQPELLDAVQAAIRGQAVTCEVQATHPRRAMLLLNAAAIPDGHGAVVVVHDTTDVHRLHQVRRDFVANVSHELRNPLATIQAAAETLASLGDHDVEDRAALISAISRQTERMGAIVRDLLDLARVESGQYPIHLEDADPGPVLDAAIAAIRPLADARGIALHCEPTDASVRCRFDPEALATVIGNLLDNAVKYIRPGDRVHVRVRPVERSVEIEVADTGPGIEEVHLPRLFERFYRVDTGRSRDLGGTGLGLSIVKHLVQAMGGTVRVRSTVAQGTTFTVCLPRPDA